MWDDPRTNWFFQLKNKEYSEWTHEEFQSCLNYLDGRITQAYKKGRKEWIEEKKDLLGKMERLGIEPYPQEDMAVKTDNEEIEEEVQSTRKNKNRVMYIEYKGDSLAGPGRIGRVQFSKSGKTIYYQGRKLETLSGRGYKANYFDVETNEEYWISGCKQKGDDTLYPGVIEIDEDAREEYWREIRKLPENVHLTSFRSMGKYSKRQPK